MSDTPSAAPHVFQAIRDVMADLGVGGIQKNREPTSGNKFKFRGIDDVLNALSPILSERNLCILPRMISRDCQERSSSNGGRLAYTTVEAEFALYSAVDGSTVTVRTFGEAMDTGDKSTNKAMSAAYKYMAIQTFCIPTEGDNDPDSTVHDVAPVKSAAKGSEVPKPPTLAERANRLEAAMRAQKDADSLRKAYALASGLCADLDLKDPERLAEIEKLYEELFNKLTATTAKPDLGIGADEIPY